MPKGMYKRSRKQTPQNETFTAPTMPNRYRVEVENHWGIPLVVFLDVPANTAKEAIEKVKENGLRFSASLN